MAKNARFEPHVVAGLVRETHQVATDSAYRLWTYQPDTGTYNQPDAEATIRREVAAIIASWGDEKLIPRPAQSDEVVKVLRDLPPSIGVEPQPYIGFSNGVIRWPSRELLPHSPEHLLTSALPFYYNDLAKPNEWMAILKQLIPDLECRRLLQECAGAMFYDGKQPKAAVVLVGESNSGKSTIQEIIAGVVGEDNIAAITPHDLDKDQFKASELFGKKANIVADLPITRMADTSVFKQVTGNDLIQANVKHRPHIRFRSTATWLCSTNELPAAGLDRTTGFYNRFLPLPMDVVIPDEAIDTTLAERILSDERETAGIINWALSGLTRLQDNQMRYTAPQKVKQAAERYYLEQNHHLEFLADTYSPSDTGRVTRKHLREDYEHWCDQQGFNAWTANYLYKRVREEWGTEQRTSKDRGWNGHTNKNVSLN